MKSFLLMIWINLLFLKNIATASPVFDCTFDNGKCPNGDFIFNPSSFVSILENQFISGHSLYRITDVTSITTPTNNGEFCDLPFTEGNYEYNHCYIRLGKFVCPTKSGIAECTLGNYVLAKTLTSGAEIAIKGTSSQITLPETGSYELSFYVLMFTNITDMTLGGDYIQVSVNSAVNSSLNFKNEKYDYTNIGKTNVWQKKSFNFNTPEENITLSVDFVRLNRTGKIGYFGFDQIEIFNLSASSSTTLTSLKTSSSIIITSTSKEADVYSSSTEKYISSTTTTSLRTESYSSRQTTLSEYSSSFVQDSSSGSTLTVTFTPDKPTFTSSGDSFPPSVETSSVTASSSSTTEIFSSQNSTPVQSTSISSDQSTKEKTDFPTTTSITTSQTAASTSFSSTSSTGFSTTATSYSPSSSSKTISSSTSSKTPRTTTSNASLNSTATGNATVTAPTVVSLFFTTTKSASSPESTSTILTATTKMRTTSTELLTSISNSEPLKISSTLKTDSSGPSNSPSPILTTLSENLDNISADKTWLNYLLGFGIPALIGFSIGICFYKSCFKPKRRVRNSDSISLHDYN